MKKAVYLFSLLFIALTSCSSDDDTQPVVNLNPDTMLLQKTVSKSYSLSSSENPDGLVTTNWFYTGMRLAYTYSSDGTRTDYTYTGDLITRKDVTKEGVTQSHLFAYNTDGKLTSVTVGNIVEITYTYNADGSITGFHDSVNENEKYTQDINMMDGEVISITTNYANGFNVLNNYGYDQLHSPTKNIIGYDKLYVGHYPYGNTKNVILRTYTDTDGIMASVNKVYTYNAAGFPTKEISRDEQVIDSYDTYYFYQ